MVTFPVYFRIPYMSSIGQGGNQDLHRSGDSAQAYVRVMGYISYVLLTSVSSDSTNEQPNQPTKTPKPKTQKPCRSQTLKRPLIERNVDFNNRDQRTVVIAPCVHNGTRGACLYRWGLQGYVSSVCEWDSGRATHRNIFCPPLRPNGGLSTDVPSIFRIQL